MKKILIGLLAFGSLSSFANDQVLIDASCKAKCVVEGNDHTVTRIDLIYLNLKGLTREEIDNYQVRAKFIEICKEKAKGKESYVSTSEIKDVCLFFKS